MSELLPTNGDAHAVPALPDYPTQPVTGPRIEYVYEPQGDVLEQYILSRSQRTFIMGPLGSGKTNASCWRTYRLMLGQEPDQHGVRATRFIAVRNTYPDLFSTTIKDWLEMFGELGRFKQGGKEPPTHFLHFRLPDRTVVKAEIIFLALDREDHIKKLRGVQATGAWINETKEIAFSIVSMLDLRMGRFPKEVWPTWYGIYGDTNAPDNDHWYYRMAEEIRPKGWTWLKQPGGVVRRNREAAWEENRGQYVSIGIPGPAENIQNLVRGYYANGVQGKQEAWVLVNLANEYGYVSDGMPVFPDYVDGVHCREFDLIPGLPIHIGLDFGLTPAAIIGQHLPSGQWRWRFEVVTTDTGVARFAGILKAFVAEKCAGYAIGSITGDPAGDQRQLGDNEERTVFQLLAANGINATPAHTNDFTVRTESVASPMRRMLDGQPGFLVHPECRVTRKGLQGAYKFRRLKIAGEERYENQPLKNAWSHPCEAGQYLNMGGGEGVAVLQPNTAATKASAEAYRALRGLPSKNEDAQGFRRRRGLPR